MRKSNLISKKFIIRTIACAMTVVVAGASTYGYTTFANPEDVSTEETQTDVNSDDKSELEDAIDNVISVSEKEIGKDETVYVIADNTGKATSTIVSDHLKNAAGEDVIVDKSDLKDIEIFLIQESQIESIYNRIDQIASQYKIKGLISRQEIHLSQYTMIPLSNVYKLNAKSLDDLFTDEDDLENLFDYLQEQFEDIQIEDLKQPLIHFANKLEIILNQKIDYDTLIGLLIHIICLIDRLKKHLSPAVHFQAASDILTKDRSTVEKVKEILLPIEQICRITISDVEAATIISIIKGKKQ